MRTFTLLLPLMLAASLQSAAPSVEPGFTTLFNGKDFTGWKISGPTESFTIQDGAIVPGTPESAPARPRLLRVMLLTTFVSGLVFVGLWVVVKSGVIDLQQLLGRPAIL